jgi:alkaline phosphatase D
VLPRRDGTVRLELAAHDAATDALLASASVDGVDPALVRGGVALVSSESRTAPGARFWFGAPYATGPGAQAHPERAFGPIAGTLFSVAGSTLKLTAQLLPLGPTDSREVRLEVRAGRGPWRLAARAPVGIGYAAQLRVDGWDASREWEYRVVYESRPRAEFAGTIPAEPRDRPLVIATINCIIASHRALDSTSNGAPRLPGEHRLGLHTERNIYFPHAELGAHLAAHDPDLLVVLGDQLYQNRPTAVDPSRAPELDFFSKYLLWLWSFGDLTRRIPSVVMVDDHDVYQGNIWGHAGAPAPGGQQNKGGYVNEAAWVNMVQRVQCGHDPDPYDPTPVEQGIDVYYGAFAYGGVSFAFLEDRKFKNTDADDTDGDPAPPRLELLGARQEAFLEAWGSMHPGLPKVLLTQTTFACFQTDEQGVARRDLDSNGWPKTGRDRALRLIKDARAVVLSGDQHLGALIQHGIDDLADGPVQFASPAGGTSFQRWFEPAPPLANGTGQPHTGDWVDGFGNRLRALAVANPKVTFAEYRAGYPTGQGLGDRTLKSEGYGIVCVDPAAEEYVLECWPWDVEPRAPGAEQFAGWPYRLGFSEA